MRTQLVRRHVAPEMLALSAVELILTFTLALILLNPAASNVNLATVHSAVMCAVTVCFIAFVIGIYRPQIFERAQNLLFSSLLSALLSFPAIWIVSKGLGLGTYWPVGYDPFRPVKIVVIWSLGVLAIRLVFLAAARLGLFVYRVAIVAPRESTIELTAVRAGRKGFLEILIISPESARPAQLASSGVQTLVVTADSKEVLGSATASELRRYGIKVQLEAEFWQQCLRRVDIAKLDDSSLDCNERQSSGRFLALTSRLFDLVFSFALLIVTLPIIGIVALVVSLDTAGAVLYRQERVGLNNTPFILLKFRSMRIDAEALGPRWAQQRDPRVTRVGLFLRRTRIDELPQLWNIFRGEMSFIGPRPERPHFVDQLSKSIPNYQERSRVKPGLTGWAQVNYPYGASVEDARAKLSFDLYYVQNRTLLLDILILLSTIRVILLQEGAR